MILNISALSVRVTHSGKCEAGRHCIQVDDEYTVSYSHVFAHDGDMLFDRFTTGARRKYVSLDVAANEYIEYMFPQCHIHSNIHANRDISSSFILIYVLTYSASQIHHRVI